MNKNVSKYASEHWSDSDYKVRAEIAHQKSVCVATSVVRKAVLETFEKAFCLGEEEMKQKATEAFRHFVEDYCNESGRKDIAAESEHYLKIFNELINA